MPEQPRHLASRLEGRVQGVVGGRLRRRGWTPRVVPFTGYGGDGWVRVLARVLLVPPGAPRRMPEDGRGWRRFLTSEVTGAEVRVRVDGRTHLVTTAGDGYVDVRLPSALAPGWRTVTLEVAGGPAVEAPVRVVGPDATLGMVSDVDDTVIVTMLPRPLVAFRNAFITRENARTPVPGMADLYTELLAAHPDLFVVYLSTGAWNVAPALRRFLDRHGYPPGPLLLTDWGPTEQGWFRSGQDHKHTQLQSLFEDFPSLRWLLVGDDGQHDPSIYAETARSSPERVAGIVIRRLTATEQVVSHGSPAPKDDPEQPTAPGVTTVLGDDGWAIARAMRERSLLLGPA